MWVIPFCLFIWTHSIHKYQFGMHSKDRHIKGECKIVMSKLQKHPSNVNYIIYIRHYSLLSIVITSNATLVLIYI